MSYTFVRLEIFSSVASKHYGRVLTSADSPIDVPMYEAKPWIKGQYALPLGPSVELSDEAHADLQTLLEATTARFLEEYRANESGTTETPRSIGSQLDDEHTGPDFSADMGHAGGAVGGSEPSGGD